MNSPVVTLYPPPTLVMTVSYKILLAELTTCEVACKTAVKATVGSRTNEPRHEKTNVLVSDQVRHKPGCTATEDG